MSNWPPDPNKTPNNNQPPNKKNNHLDKFKSNMSANNSGREWHLLEKTLMASIEEQRRSRRWRIFFRLLGFGYVLLLLLAFNKGCTPTDTGIATVGINEPHIAVVDVQGVISSKDVANASDISAALTEAYKTPEAKAVVLNINSPGGSPVQSDEIWQTMMELRKEYPDTKLYAVIGDMGASGAYYIASAADEIYVNRSSLVGSIGVIMSGYDIEGLMDKFGVKDRTITAGEYKDILNMSRPMTEFEKEHVDKVLANTHKHFITAVEKGRSGKLKDPEANKIFSGLFWTGEQAIELGLADKVGSLRTIKKDLELDNAVNYTPLDPVHELFGNFAMKMGVGIGSSIDMKMLPESEATGEMR